MNKKVVKHLRRAQELLDFGLLSAVNEENFKRLSHVGSSPTNTNTACAACALQLLGAPPRFIKLIENHEDVHKLGGIHMDDLLHVIHEWERENGGEEKDLTTLERFAVPGSNMIETVQRIWEQIRPGYGTLLLIKFGGRKIGHYVAAFMSANELRPSIFDTQHIHDPSKSISPQVSVEGYTNIADAFRELDVRVVYVFAGGMAFDSSNAEYDHPSKDTDAFMSRSPSELEKEKRPIRVPSDPHEEREIMKKKTPVKDLPHSIITMVPQPKNTSFLK